MGERMGYEGKLSLVIRLAILTVLYFLCFAVVAALLIPAPSEQAAPTGAGPALVALLAVSFLNTVVLAYIIIRSQWTGWKLILTVFFIFYGVVTVMSQIETAVFVTGLPPGMLPRLFLVGAIVAALFSLFAVAILGKTKSGPTESNRNLCLNMPIGEWVGKLFLIVIAYVVIYFTFGYFIAWQSAAVRAYYGGSDPGSFLTQMTTVLRDSPWLLLLQAVRAILWTAIALPVVRMMKGRWWEAGLAVALLFAVVMNSQLLLPNPYMPPEVRMAHLVETASSNFLFGWLVVFVLCRWRWGGGKTAEGIS